MQKRQPWGSQRENSGTKTKKTLPKWDLNSCPVHQDLVSLPFNSKDVSACSSLSVLVREKWFHMSSTKWFISFLQYLPQQGFQTILTEVLKITQTSHICQPQKLGSYTLVFLGFYRVWDSDIHAWGPLTFSQHKASVLDG